MVHVSIRVDNVSKVFKSGKVGLQPCTFEIESNTLTAILGPSGCGKSTLLKALIGDEPKTTGSIYIEGLELNENNFDYIKTHIGYVPQDDIIHKDLTVFQCLKFSARLRLSDFDFSQQDIRVEEVISDLGLEQIKDQLISEISGGQRKRVAIGVEILTKPKVLFLDEPTSPLDPQTIEEFLKILKRLARNGTTVLMVTHKPEDLAYMDDCVFMGVGGYITYKGSPSGLVNFFGKSNIIEIYSIMDSNMVSEYYNNFISNSKKLSLIETNKSNFNPNRHTNFFSQTIWLTIRYSTRKFNDFGTLLIQLCQAPIIALLVISIFKQLDQTVLFFIVISAIWFGTNNSSKEIVSEEKIFKRERMYNQGIVPYIFSKILVLSVLGFFQSFIFVYILFENYRSSVVSVENPLELISWMVFITIVSTLFGLTLSTVASSTEKVMGMIPIVLIPQIMFSGVMVKLIAIYVKLPSFLLISRWAMTGTSRIQTKIYDKFDSEAISSIEYLRSNLGDTYDFISPVSLEFIVLVTQMCFFFSLIYLILKDKYS